MRKILSVVGIIIALILAVILFNWVVGINSDTRSQSDEPAITITGAKGVKRIQQLEAESDSKSVEFGDFIYLGGPWGLLVGSKVNEDFQQYLTQNPVQNVSIKENFLQYAELSGVDGNWEEKVVNLNAYENFLRRQ